MSITQDQAAVTAPPRKQRGHTAPKAPIIGLDQYGRLRVAHLLAILSVSHAHFYAGDVIPGFSSSSI
jgi:hypothetical protein